MKRLLSFWAERRMDEWSSHTEVRGTIILRVLQIYYSSELISLSWATAGLNGILLLWARDECCYLKFSTLWCKENKVEEGKRGQKRHSKEISFCSGFTLCCGGCHKIPGLYLHLCTFWYTFCDLIHRMYYGTMILTTVWLKAN